MANIFVEELATRKALFNFTFCLFNLILGHQHSNDMNREIHPLSSKFNFLIRYCGIVAVTLYCGFMGLIGGIILSGFVLQKFGWTFSTVSSPSTEDLAEWIGGALVGALPLGFIGANWMGRKVGWLK